MGVRARALVSVLIAVAVFAGVVALGLRGGAQDRVGPSSRSASSKPDADLSRFLPTIADFPAGWTVSLSAEPQRRSPSQRPNGVEPAGCGQIPEPPENGPSEIMSEDRREDFGAPDVPVSLSLGRSGAGIDYSGVLREYVARCGRVVETWASAQGQQELGRGSAVNELLEAGDGAVRLRTTCSKGSSLCSRDARALLAAQVGDVVVAATVGAADFGAAAEHAFALTVERLRAADGRGARPGQRPAQSLAGLLPGLMDAPALKLLRQELVPGDDSREVFSFDTGDPVVLPEGCATSPFDLHWGHGYRVDLSDSNRMVGERAQEVFEGSKAAEGAQVRIALTRERGGYDVLALTRDWAKACASFHYRRTSDEKGCGPCEFPRVAAEVTVAQSVAPVIPGAESVTLDFGYRRENTDDSSAPYFGFDRRVEQDEGWLDGLARITLIRTRGVLVIAGRTSDQDEAEYQLLLERAARRVAQG